MLRRTSSRAQEWQMAWAQGNGVVLVCSPKSITSKHTGHASLSGCCADTPQNAMAANRLVPPEMDTPEGRKAFLVLAGRGAAAEANAYSILAVSAQLFVAASCTP